jgi:EpsI family protein
MRRITAFVPALAMATGCALVWHTHQQKAMPLAGSLASIMASADGYDVRELEIGERQREVAGMTQFVARAYQRDRATAFTTLVSYYDRQTQGKTIHSPRNCLPGAGWEVVSAGTRVIEVGGMTRTVNRFILQNGRSAAVAYYWYQGRGRVTANEYVVKWNLLRDAALHGRTEEALVRVVVPLAPPSVAIATAREQVDEDATASMVAARLIKEVEQVLPPVQAAKSRT